MQKSDINIELQQLFEKMREGIWIIDNHAKTVYVNETLATTFGFKKEEMIGKSLFNFIDERMVESAKIYFKRRENGISEEHEFEFLDNAGNKFKADIYTSPLVDKEKNFNGAIAYFLSSSHLKKTKQKLKESERRMSSLLNNLIGMAYRCQNNKNWTMEFVSRGCFDLTGYKAIDILFDKEISFGELIYEDDIEYVWNTIQTSIKNDQSFQLKYRIVNASGEIKWILEQGRAVRLGEKIPLIIEGYLIDITKQEETEQSLRDSESFLNSIFDQSPFSTWISDNKGTLIRINEACCKLLNITPEEVINEYNLFKDNIVIEQGHLELIRSVYEDGKNVNFILYYDSSKLEHLSLANYTHVILDVAIFPIKNHEGNVINAIIQHKDITLQKLIEDKLKDSEREYREAFNRVEFYKDLFTHDISNILHSIKMGLKLSEIYMDDPKKFLSLKDNFTLMKEQVNRGTNLVSNIRKLSNMEEIDIKLNKIEVLGLLKKIREKLKKTYQKRNISIQIISEMPQVLIKANQLIEDVFENLLLNSIVHNQNQSVTLKIYISRLNINNNDMIRMEFIDNGIGIEDSRKDIIFYRGFKEFKNVHGMGLGLYLVNKIIENFYGKIWVEDAIPGNYTLGSKFIVEIPDVNKI